MQDLIYYELKNNKIKYSYSTKNIKLTKYNDLVYLIFQKDFIIISSIKYCSGLNNSNNLSILIH